MAFTVYYIAPLAFVCVKMMLYVENELFWGETFFMLQQKTKIPKDATDYNAFVMLQCTCATFWHIFNVLLTFYRKKERTKLIRSMFAVIESIEMPIYVVYLSVKTCVLYWCLITMDRKFQDKWTLTLRRSKRFILSARFYKNRMLLRK